MLNERQFDDLIETIYEAALNPNDWRLVVDQLTTGFNVIGASVYTPFTHRTGLEPIWSTNADPQFIAEYARRYANGDILSDALWKHVPTKSLVYSWDDIISRKELEAWGGYDDLLRSRGVKEGIGLLVDAEDHRAGQLMIYCPKWDAAQIDAAKRIFERVSRHLSRAMRVHWHLTAARQVADVSKMALDMFQSGVVWLSATGDVLYINTTMERILESGDGVSLLSKRLTFHDRGNTADLQKAIDRAIANQVTSFQIERQAKQVSLKMTVLPLPLQATALRLPQAAAIGFISESETPSSSSLDMAASIYRLTPAESRVLGEMLKGRDVREIGAELGTAESTVRTQIKHLMEKCGVGRQADLIRMVATMPQVARLR